jgi:hypothetical protein
MGDLAGYSVHPAFVTDGVTRDKIYMSAFEGTAATSTGTLRSISGAQPLGSRTLPQMRTQAQARGTGWELQTYQATQALQVLYLIEYADFDSQTTIGKGYVDASIGAGNQSINTGATISLGNASGSASGGTDGLRAISYRGVENFWGNIHTWVDGLNLDNREAFIANDSFESNKFTSPYVSAGNLATSNGFVTNILFPEFLATAVGGSSTSHLHDRHTQTSGNAIARFGGWWNEGSNAGAFFWSLSRPSTESRADTGARIQIL